MKVARLIPAVFAVLTAPLLFFAAFGYAGASPFFDVIGQTGVLFVIFVCVAILLALFVVTFRVLDRLSDRGVRFVTIGLFVLMAVGMVVLLCNFHALHIADEYFMLDEARFLAYNPDRIIDTDNLYSGYFGRYGNNYFLTIVFMRLYRLAAALHIADDYRMLVAINAACIYAANAFAYACVRCMRGPRAAAKALVLLVVNPISYPLIFWVYSCTVSAPLLAAAVWLGLLAYKAQDRPHQILFAVLSGINGALSYQIRPTSLIPLVAAAMLAAFYVCVRRDQFRRVAVQAAVCLVTLLLVSKALALTYKSYVSQEELDMNFPISHWIMMSSHGDGELVDEEREFTKQFKTKEERRTETVKRALQHYRENGVSGTVRLFLRKTAHTFSDGVSLTPSRLAQDDMFSPLYQYLAGTRKGLYTLHCQAFRIVTLLLMVAAGVLSWRKRAVAPDWWLMMTTVMGGYVFYCLWETKAVYSMPFVSIMCCCASLGCSELIASAESLSERSRIQIVRWSWTALAAVVGLALVVMYSVLVKTNYGRTNDVRCTTLTGNALSAIKAMYEEGDELAQEVVINRPINRVSLNVKDHDKTDDASTYRLEICDADGMVLVRRDFNSNQVTKGEYTSAVKVPVEYDPGDEPKDCLIKITLVHKGDSPLKFTYRRFAGIDAFAGTAYVNGAAVPYDVEVGLYYRTEVPYLSRKLCVLLYATILAWLLAIFAASRWADGNEIQIDEVGEKPQLAA